MLKRAITGFFILLSVIGFILLKQFSNLFFDALVMIIMYCSLYETIKVYKKDLKSVDYSLYLMPAIMCLIFNLESDTFKAIGYVILTTIIFILYLLSSEIILYSFRRKEIEKEKEMAENDAVYAMNNAGKLLNMSPEYINRVLFDKTKNTLLVYDYPVLVLTFLLAINHIETNLSFMGIILAFGCSMMTDTFAYLFGKAFGKKKFIPEVSPNKTIAGLIGGFVGGILSATICILCFAYFEPFKNTVASNKNLFILIFSVLGILGALADTLGDLIASALKRKAGVKDYGSIFPGHGGFMDRVDGLMFTTSIIYILFALFLI